MNCIECQEIISDYVDGALELGEQTKIEQHLANCESCRAVRDDLLQIVHFSKQLPLHTPTGDLWSRIQSEIEAEQPKTIWARAKVWWNHFSRRDFNLTIPRLVAVAAAFIIVVAVGVGALRNTSFNPPQFSQSMQFAPDQKLSHTDSQESDFQEYEQRINQLKESVEQRKEVWGAELRISFERNMIYVDQSLNDCRQQLTRDPADEAIRELLKKAYSEKVRVLEGFANF